LVKTNLPKFPDSYIGKKAVEYDSLRWMERNQKRTTQKILNFLDDKKLGKINHNFEKDLPLYILDLGCGTGFSSEILINAGFRVIGVDILEDMLSKANNKKTKLKNHNLELILADIAHLPFKTISFHYIVSISAYNFITHYYNSQREKVKIVNNTAKYLYKILKDNGRIIIEFYPENVEDLELFTNSFILNGFEGFIVKTNPKQKSGQTFLLLKK
jgi:18S rRNA (guanine1575-N7)-methyltransferase